MPVRYQVKITRTAEGDLREIWDYIGKDSPREAERFISRIEHQITTLEQYPERCPSVIENEVLGTDYRHILYGDYRTIFRISLKTVYILRIIHGSRLLDDSAFGYRKVLSTTGTRSGQRTSEGLQSQQVRE
jgi:toxin ParE1/3/4